MAELANCSTCGKLFVQTTSSICPSCRQELDQKFEVVWKFIRKRENREATVTEIYEATHVEEKLIFQWIQEGRLQVKDFKNLSYPCELCGEPVQSGKLCSSCKSTLAKDLANTEGGTPTPPDSQRKRTYFTK